MKSKTAKTARFHLARKEGAGYDGFLLIIIIFLLLAIFGRLENVGKGERDNAGKRDRK